MKTKYNGIRAAFKALFCLLALAPAEAQSPFISYAERSKFALAAPGGLDAGLYGYANPALLSYVEHMENVLAWSTASNRHALSNQWGLFSALPHLGFGLIRQEFNGRQVGAYRLGLSGGDRSFSLGLAAGWASGQSRFFGRKGHFVLGGLWRPSPHLSFGATLTSTYSASAREGTIDLALRPLGNERLTLFADYANASADGTDFWSTGAILEVLPGLALTGRYFDNRTISVGLNLGLGAASVQTQSRFDRDGARAFATHAIRLGSHQDNALHALFHPQPRYLELDLLGPVRHRRYAFFDHSQTLVDLLALIERARRDPTIKGLAIKASGLRVNPEMAWELREKLRQFRAYGKRVVIYIDRVDIYGYHFASVADYLVLDPAGMLGLEGYVAGQTYFKGALNKLGIGFDEWRFYKYKSFMETYVREDMSAAEREQLQILLDDWYGLARSDIGKDRALASETFDRLVDETAVFLPQEALNAGLVDRLSRWDEIDAIVEELETTPYALVPAASHPRPVNRRWSARNKVAIVYALGVCAMDSGIRARTLVDDIATACDAADAVVLRVDSPGGDILPSDLVASAVQKCREQKPVVVSQGFLAASGGYMISMYGDAIVAAPNTITGSIGVIAGWAYNQGLKEKLGLSTDHVQAGRHADLPFGMILPLLGLNLPDRNLNQGELARMEHTIRAIYADFVAKVASGRDMSPTAVDAIAQGRVWTGQRAVELGLVDRLGGLEIAINLAKEMADLPADEPVARLEFPQPQLFSPSFLRSRLLNAQTQSNPQLDYLQFRLKHNGLPLLLAPPGHLPSATWPYGEIYE
ncbi:MAG: S49 family peptidase [Candidatus Latescibacterota bacterium]|nr:S49 family peptidase [Candidatus Latescibacterota bacterium]